MKKLPGLVSLVCTCTLLIAQENPKFSVSAFISPTLAHRICSINYSGNGIQLVDYNAIETPKLGYSAGLLAGYAVHKKIRIQAGVSFSNNGFLFKKTDLTYGSQWDSTGVNQPPPAGTPTAMRIAYQYYFIDIPVQLKYTFFIKNKVSFYASTGMEANFNLANKETVTYWYGDDKERETQDFPTGDYKVSKYNFSVIAAIGVDISLSKKIGLFVQPTYRQMLLSDVDVLVERRLYSVGLATGVSMNL